MISLCVLAVMAVWLLKPLAGAPDALDLTVEEMSSSTISTPRIHLLDLKGQFDPWGGRKRGEDNWHFSPWGGKRNFNSWGGKRDSKSLLGLRKELFVQKMRNECLNEKLERILQQILNYLFLEGKH